MKLDDIQLELAPISHIETLLYGSYLQGGFRQESDIDIALLARTADFEIMKRMKIDAITSIPARYDVQIFEALPTVVKASILRSYEVIFGDPLQIGEYLYRYWKEWQDYQFRFELPSVQEMRKAADI